MSQGTLFIISAPSGAGKTSLVKALLEKIEQLVVAVSHTTREKRAVEKEGVNYFFVEPGTFEDMIKADAFIEHAKVFNHQYGTSKAELNKHLDAGLDVILEIDWQGADQVRQQFSNTVAIFILPPSMESLEDRLQKRQQDSDEAIKTRLAQAREEMGHCAGFDYLIVNEDFDAALEDLLAIIRAQRLQQARQGKKQANLLAKLLA